ncbi:MAG: DUF4113 domain-containing protein [Zoogloea sp.]|nr:DUF4113 domain-containing protein [Zoogloea sp.]
MAIVAEKLRRQGCLAGAVQVYIRTNVFKPDVPQHQQAVTLPLPAPTDDTRALTQWVFRILKRIYRPGYADHKAGMMQVLDEINGRYGRRTLQFAPEGITRSWTMRRDRLSPGYTTRWEELPKVLAR